MKRRVILISIVVIILAALVLWNVRQEGTKEWRTIKPQVLPQLVPAANKESVDIVNQPLSTTIDIAYVIDKPHSYDFIMEADLEKWEITEEILQETAVENLDELAKSTTLEVSSVPGKLNEKYIIIEVDDGYAAARLLSERIRKTVVNELGTTAIAAIPTRDFLIFWNEKFSLTDQFAEQVQTEYDAAITYKLSPNLFLVSEDVIGMLQKSIK